jgi:DNA polymerase I-like protein with 3'-5' exonuclease and polymerase domains
VANVTKLSEEDAAGLITRFFHKAQALKSWLDTQGALALAFGFTSTQRGRKRFYRLPTKQAETEAKTAEERKEAKDARKEREAQIRRQACNQPIQSSCVDILKQALVKIYLALRGGSRTGKRLYDAYIMFTMHDEIVMRAREDQAEAVAKIMKDCMLEAYNDVIKSVTHGPLEVTISDYWEKK